MLTSNTVTADTALRVSINNSNSSLFVASTQKSMNVSVNAISNIDTRKPIKMAASNWSQNPGGPQKERLLRSTHHRIQQANLPETDQSISIQRAAAPRYTAQPSAFQQPSSKSIVISPPSVIKYSQKSSISSISNSSTQPSKFNAINFMSTQIDQLKSLPKATTKTSDSKVAEEIQFSVSNLQDGGNTQVNYQDKLFGKKSTTYSPQAVYPSMLRRTHLGVFGNVSRRMNVVMAATSSSYLDTLTEAEEDTQVDPAVPQVDEVSPVTIGETLEASSVAIGPEKSEEIVREKIVRLQPKPGKLAARLIKRMEGENVREERDVLAIPTLGPLGDKKFWDFNVFPKAYKGWSAMNKKDKIVAGLIASIHGLALAAPFTYSANMLKLFAAGYLVNCFGITMSFHRQLTHKSFETDKWLEHFFAFWGILGVQGHPIEWVSAHRHHHNQCDDVADPHSPYDGFWWSHMGWMFDSKSQALLFDTTNAKDMKKDDFYVWAKKHYLKITLAQPLVYYALGGFPAVVWGFALRTVFCWHITWAVNSVSHVWGRQMFKTGDISMNNGLVGALAMGEGWHNNHHAFEKSCRHGMKWWQIDGTWYFILALEKLGLARKLNYPSKARMEKLAW